MIYHPRIPRPALAAAMMAAMLAGGQAARASGPLWYNGNSDGRDGYTNQTGTPDGLVYDNFIVPAGSTWTVTSVFSNDAMSVAATTAYWEIRSGVSSGNGGTLLYSGDGADTQTATGNSYNYNGVASMDEYTNSVNVSGVTLGPGTYWLAVVPDNSGFYFGGPATYIDTTSGAGAR